MTFKIDNEVIMTADSGKGRIFDNLTDGEYRTKIKDITNSPGLPICALDKDGRQKHFALDGSCSTHPGMSIRLVKEEAVNENIAKCTKCNGTTRNINTHECPSQWIEGEAPPVGERTGGVFIGKHGWEKPVYYGIDEIIRIEKYTHWQYVQLPPPPPVKEVEAFGYLEYCMNWSDDLTENKKKAMFFYSRPATVEVLNKYLRTTGKSIISGEMWDDSWSKNNLEIVIHQVSNLFFTPAALEELGIK